MLVSHKTPPADDRGMDYVEMARRLMTVGGNPFNNPGRHKLASGDAIADIFEQDFPNQLSFLFRDTIARYYRALAHTYRKTGAHFFAEKSDIDADTRIGVRMLLGELREIVMIRDPRDFMCSAKAFWKMTPEQALETVAYTTRRMEEIAAEQALDTLFVRYEDLIQDPVATRQAIGRFVGIEPPAGADARGDAKAGAALLGIHATSASPERSIGRWASDLDAAEIAACNARFASFMARFGYGAAAPAPKPAQAASVQAASVQAASVQAASVQAASVQAGPPAAASPAPPAPLPPAAEPPPITAYDLAGPPGAAGRAPPAPEAAAFAIAFGRTGDAGRYQDTGWANGEHGYTWTNAGQSVLQLPRPGRPGVYQLRLHVAPFVAAGRLAAQRLAIAVNGQPLGEVSLGRPSVLECRLDWQVLARADPIRLAFTMPDAARPTEVTGHPNDTRLLGLSFQRLWLVGPLVEPPAEAAPTQPGPARPEPAPPAVAPTAVAPVAVAPVAFAPAAVAESAPIQAALAQAPAKLLLRFESLGENCEFGLVQRRTGVDPLGLFRFASAPLSKLMGALTARFASMGEPEHLMIEVSPNGREYMVFEKRFEFRYHAWVGVQEKTAEEVLAREVRRLPFLVRKLVADLTEGAKIFVFHGMHPLTEAEAFGLARAIRSFGPGTLLWVELADAENPPGSVRRLADGLLKGHMDRFAPVLNAHDISLQCWIDLCVAALEAAAQEPLEMARA